MVEQLAGQFDPLTLVLRPATATSLVPLPWTTRPIKDPYELDVVFHEMKYAPHDVLLYWVGCWLLRPDELDLSWYEIVESPTWFVDCNTKWSAMLLVVIGGILGKRNKLAFPNYFPEAMDAHDGLLMFALAPEGLNGDLHGGRGSRLGWHQTLESLDP